MKVLLALVLAAGAATLPGTFTVRQGKGTGPSGEWQVQLIDGGSLSIVGAVSVNIVDAGAPLNINPPASLPLPAGAATDATLSQLLDGGVLQLGRSSDGTARAIAVTEQGVQWVQQLPFPLQRPNPLGLPCNAVRRTNCR